MDPALWTHSHLTFCFTVCRENLGLLPSCLDPRAFWCCRRIDDPPLELWTGAVERNAGDLGFGLRFGLVFGISSFSILRLLGLSSDYLFIFSYLIDQYDDSTLGRVGPFKLEGWVVLSIMIMVISVWHRSLVQSQIKKRR